MLRIGLAPCATVSNKGVNVLSTVRSSYRAPDHRRITHSRNQVDTGGAAGIRKDTPVLAVRDREAPGSNPGPPILPN